MRQGGARLHLQGTHIDPAPRYTQNRSATRGRVSSCETGRITPGVLPPVPYQDMRLEQSDGVKLLGQCSLTRKGGNQSVRRDCDCKHQCGTGARANGTANRCELLINVVMHNKPKVMTGLNQKGMWQGSEASYSSDADNKATGGEAEPHPFWYSRGTWKTSNLPKKGKRLARGADEVAGTGRWKKRKPRGNNVDKG